MISNTHKTNEGIFFYPSGAGGHWIMHTLHCLISESLIQYSDIAVKSYHDATIVSILNNDHWNYNPTANKIDFSDYCIFNFYINYIKKIILDRKYDDKNNFTSAIDVLNKIFKWYDFNDLLKSNVGHLSYTELWQNPNKFKFSFYRAFSLHNIKIANFSQKQDFFDYKINEFKNTVADPTKYYNNSDNIFWVAWCYGVLTHFNILPDVYKFNHYPNQHIAEIKKIVEIYHNECILLTNKMIYCYKD